MAPISAFSPVVRFLASTNDAFRELYRRFQIPRFTYEEEAYMSTPIHPIWCSFPSLGAKPIAEVDREEPEAIRHDKLKS